MIPIAMTTKIGMMKFMRIDLKELINSAPENIAIMDSLGVCLRHINDHQNILVSVSGGRDSDVMLDLNIRCGGKDKSTYVFFDTGMEYEATKNQIKHLEEKYGIKIQTIKPIKPIPLCVREYGVPFYSKYVSEMIERLQRHGFQWEDEPFEVLVEKYPKCSAALSWWCNRWGKGRKDGNVSNFDIGYVKGLKEFLIANPPPFRISNKCCKYAKKGPAKKYLAEHDFDLNCVGVRKSEGGIRSARYKNCYTASMEGPDQYRPIFWFSDKDRDVYDEHYGLNHSDCYSVWGMDRTGCVGCPFSKNFEQEIVLAEKYEPKRHKAMLKIFGESYEYRRKFEAFKREKL